MKKILLLGIFSLFFGLNTVMAQCATPTISEVQRSSSSACVGQEVTFSITPEAGVTYHWWWDTGGSEMVYPHTSGGAQITLRAKSVYGIYGTVYVKNSCGNVSETKYFSAGPGNCPFTGW